MMNRIEINKFLNKLGLNSKEVQVYVHLCQHNSLSPLEIARQTRINRTTIYRVLESLKEKGLIEEELDYKSSRFSAINPDNLRLIIAKKETQLSYIKDQLPNIINALTATAPPSQTPTRVLYYKGKQGLKQLLYNTLRAKDEVIGYGFGSWNDGVGNMFAEKLRQEYVDRKIKAREILNKVDEKGSHTKVSGYLKGIYHHRSIPKKILTINHDTYIYNDAFAFYHNLHGELFAVEIINADIANTQKQIFEILWKMAK